MINQQEKRPLSVGSAVQFTHKGKTIHGHLLQRQGRRRFAQVVDTEERTWKVPESALKHSGGARLATIVTRHDKARADYRVGDEVTFTSPDGPRRGVNANASSRHPERGFLSHADLGLRPHSVTSFIRLYLGWSQVKVL